MRAGYVVSVALGAALVLSAGSAGALANDRLNERISGSACEPETAAERPLVSLSGTTWIFAPDQVGTVTLVCPVYTPYWDETNGQRYVDELRLWYQDGDGAAAGASVSAALGYRLPDQALGVVLALVSPNSGALTTPTTIAVPVNGVAMEDAQYHVRVTMTRTAVTQSVRFRGVSFLQEP